MSKAAAVLEKFEEGDAIRFRVGPTGTTWRTGRFIRDNTNPEVVTVQLDGDPFAVCVQRDQVEHNHQSESVETESRRTSKMTTATKRSPKELRREAKNLGVTGWEEMTARELEKAIAEAESGAERPRASKKAASRSEKTAKKTSTKRAAVVDDEDEDEAPRARKSTKKAAPAKASTKKAAPQKAGSRRKAEADEETGEGVNPYKEGSNLFYITEELLRGGKRSDMVKRLKRKIELKPRQRAGDDYDTDSELDRRVLIVGQLLERDHGFNVVRDGRGKDAFIQAEPQ